MYDFKDKGDRLMALKPESTTPAMRALVEHNLCPQGTVTRLCYVSSPHLRYDRPQKGRLREDTTNAESNWSAVHHPPQMRRWWRRVVFLSDWA